MGFLKFIELNFTEDFFEKKLLLNFFSGVNNKATNDEYLNPNKELEEGYQNKIYLIHFIPPFLELRINQRTSFSFFTLNHFKGMLCDLSNFNTADDYLKAQMGGKGRRNVTSRLKRLETCFDITYKMYYGAIDKDEYSALMDKFHAMIIKRFSQRGVKHGNLDDWNFYKDSAFNMILNKKASLFIVSNNNIPIAISLGYMYQNVFESAISSYEIDYAKFGLGNVVVLKKMEWCFDNGYSIFNMRWGDYKYKRDWCNTRYDYKTYVVYNKKSLIQTLKAYTITKKNVLSAYLIKNKNHFGLLAKIRWYLVYGNTPRIKVSDDVNKPKYEVVNTYDNLDTKKRVQIEISDAEYTFLRKPIFDFQYSNSEKSDRVKVFRINHEIDSTYLVQGEKSSQVLIYK